METKEIIIPQGWEVEKIKNGKIILKEVVERLPKTWEEFCEKNREKKGEVFISNLSDLREVNEPKRRESFTNRNVLPDRQTANAFLALMQLIQLRDCYRQGWQPDWENNKYKQCIVCYEGNIKQETYAHAQFILSFQSKEIRDEFLKNFRDLIVQAKELI